MLTMRWPARNAVSRTNSDSSANACQIKRKVCLYIAQYPVRWTAYSALHFIPNTAAIRQRYAIHVFDVNVNHVLRQCPFSEYRFKKYDVNNMIFLTYSRLVNQTSNCVFFRFFLQFYQQYCVQINDIPSIWRG